MNETNFYKNKIYLPLEVRRKLGLVEGDRLEIEVIGRGEARLRVKRRSRASGRVLERLMNPPDLGALKIKLTREEIYKDAL